MNTHHRQCAPVVVAGLALFLASACAMAADPAFALVIKTDNSGPSGDHGFTVPLQPACTYDCHVDWGDGTGEDVYGPGSPSHAYGAAGTYTVRVTENSPGGFPAIWFNGGGDCLKVLSLANWGSVQWSRMDGAFDGCGFMTITATDGATAGTGLVVDFSRAWAHCASITSFPAINTSSGMDFHAAWTNCVSLTAFPAIDCAAGRDFSSAWANCVSLATFPAIDTAAGTDFSHAWDNCRGLSAFPQLSTGSGTDFSFAWSQCLGLGSFPQLDTSAATDLTDAWSGCTALTSFPLLDTGAVTTFVDSWANCRSLTSFPAIDTSSGRDFSYAWIGCGFTSVPAFDLGNMVNGQSCFAYDRFTTASYSALLVDLAARNHHTGVMFNGGYSTYDGTAADARNATLILALGWSISDGGRQQRPVLSCPDAAFARGGVAFSYAITADGEPTSFTASGLPQGLVVDTVTGVITGTAPVRGGTYSIELGASNAEGTGHLSLALTVQGSVADAAALANPRYLHTTTVLPDGRVLVAGGIGSYSSSAACEIMDPGSGRWRPGAPMGTPRYGHSGTLLANGLILVAGGQGTWQPAASSELFDPSADRWLATGSLAGPRAYHSATLLPSGKVLVSGGSGSSSILSTCELYDPSAGTWTGAGTLLRQRESHTATLLEDGRVLIAGGTDAPGSYLASCEIYDPADGSVVAVAPMSTARSGFAAVLLPDGRVLVSGGEGGVPSCELFDPATGTWTATGSMLHGRGMHTATLLVSGDVLVAGGIVDYGNTTTTSCELYHPANGTWAEVGVLAHDRAYHGAALLPSGQVLFTGGFEVWRYPVECEVFTPPTVDWQASGALVTWESQHTATLLPDGRVLAVGGEGDLTLSQVYDPASGTWARTGSTGDPRMQHQATLLSSGRVLVSGGYDGLAASSSCELFEPASGTWTRTGSLPVAVRNHAAVQLASGNVLVVGGWTNAADSTDRCAEYDPGLGAWQEVGRLGTPRSDAAAVVLRDGRVLVFSGGMASCELYDPVAQTWSPTGAMSCSRAKCGYAMLPDGRVLAAGGTGPYQGWDWATCEIYDPPSGTWSATGSLCQARWGLKATALSTGRILVSGGYSYPASVMVRAECEEFDPANGQWTRVADLFDARVNHQATLLPSGLVLISGGFNPDTGYNYQSVSEGELYDPGTASRYAVVGLDGPVTIDADRSLGLTGSGFRPTATASSCGVSASAGNLPLAHVLRADGMSAWLPWTPGTAPTGTACTVALPPGMMIDGPALIQVCVNGIPSALRPAMVVNQLALLTSDVDVVYDAAAHGILTRATPAIDGSTSLTTLYEPFSGDPRSGGAPTGPASTNAPVGVGWYRATVRATGTRSGIAVGSVHIRLRELQVTVDDATRPFGGADPAFTGTIVGAIDGDGISASYATVAIAMSPPGTYPITASVGSSAGSLGNYHVTSSPGVLTVTQGLPGVVLPDGGASVCVYDGLPHPVVPSFAPALDAGSSAMLTYQLWSGDPAAGGSAVASAVETVAPPIDAGWYRIKVVVSGNRSGSVFGSLHVRPAELLVSSDNASRRKGQDNPVFTGSIAGQIAGDDITADYGCDATSESPPGIYPIVITLHDPGSRLANYSLTLREGALTILGHDSSGGGGASGCGAGGLAGLLAVSVLLLPGLGAKLARGSSIRL